LPSRSKVCFSRMPARLASRAILSRATSSSRLSVGYAMAFSCTVVSTITRSNSRLVTAPIATAVSIVVLSNCSTPASPNTRRKRPICVASQGSFGA
jgi:hypothetical protein